MNEVNQAHLARVAVDGSDYRDLYTSNSARNLMSGLAWSKDSQAILFLEVDRRDNGQLMRLPLMGGQPEFTGLEVTGVDDIDLDTKGSRIAFSSATATDEVWVLDNVLPALKASRQ